VRYFALMIPGQKQSVVLFPDFPDIVSTGPTPEEALRAARRELIQRIAMLRWLGASIPPPMNARAIRNSSHYCCSVVAIVAVLESTTHRVSAASLMQSDTGDG
jgi:predicted RNase H-like HicB family nuclease